MQEIQGRQEANVVKREIKFSFNYCCNVTKNLTAPSADGEHLRIQRPPPDAFRLYHWIAVSLLCKRSLPQLSRLLSEVSRNWFPSHSTAAMQSWRASNINIRAAHPKTQTPGLRPRSPVVPPNRHSCHFDDPLPKCPLPGESKLPRSSS
jgi:hypothetical protein